MPNELQKSIFQVMLKREKGTCESDAPTSSWILKARPWVLDLSKYQCFMVVGVCNSIILCNMLYYVITKPLNPLYALKLSLVDL